MNVGVAIRALYAHVGKHQARMALRAADALVHSAQWVTRLVVVELDNIAERFPAAEGMAVFTRDVQVPMRAARCGVLVCLFGSEGACRQRQEDEQ